MTKGQSRKIMSGLEKFGRGMGTKWARKNFVSECYLWQQVNTGAPVAIRTRDLWLRKPTLYPAELRALYNHLK